MDDETIARLVGMKRAGIKQADIAKRLGLTCNQVKSISRKVKAYANLNHSNGFKRHYTWAEVVRIDDE